jgi:aromatic ring-opening dioxygenase catalytic subunit (LigB family)
MLPTFFVAHGGGPLPLMGEEPADFLTSFPRNLTLEEKNMVKTILIVSAHWEENRFTVSSSPKPSMLFDYYGFPPKTYEYKYNAPGNPILARKIQDLLKIHNIECNLDENRGFDHATFVPLILGFPEGKIPVVQISIKSDFDPLDHIILGEVLAEIRNEVLIIGSGFSFHNLPLFMSGMDSKATAKSEKFDKWLRSAILDNKWEDTKKMLLEWKKAPEALFAQPREDHFLPLLVVFGASKNCKPISILDTHIYNAKVSSFMFR